MYIYKIFVMFELVISKNVYKLETLFYSAFKTAFPFWLTHKYNHDIKCLLQMVAWLLVMFWRKNCIFLLKGSHGNFWRSDDLFHGAPLPVYNIGY